MAIATTPDRRIPVTLEEDAELPEEERTTFHIHILTHRQAKELRQRHYQAISEINGADSSRSAGLRTGDSSPKVDPTDPASPSQIFTDADADPDTLSPDTLAALEAMDDFYTWCVENHLLGWQNFKDPDGNDVPFIRDEPTSISPPFLDLLSTPQVHELGRLIVEHNTLGAADRGN
jgi:hypothetical protein|tara:strand:+ start:5464 stop:5991 length:528 start_codon:yes stop_codon:yes gene_type:complete